MTNDERMSNDEGRNKAQSGEFSVLNYAEPSLKTVSKWSYRTIILSGAAPLVTGLAIFLLFLITRSHWLVLAGAVTVVIGLPLLGSGMIVLIGYYRQERRAMRMSLRELRLRVALAAVLLVS